MSVRSRLVLSLLLPLTLFLVAGPGSSTALAGRGSSRAKAKRAARRKRIKQARKQQRAREPERGPRGGREATGEDVFRRAKDPTRGSQRLEDEATRSSRYTETGSDFLAGRRRLGRRGRIRMAVAGFLVAAVMAGSGLIGGEVIHNWGHWPTPQPPPITQTTPLPNPVPPMPDPGHSGGGVHQPAPTGSPTQQLPGGSHSGQHNPGTTHGQSSDTGFFGSQLQRSGAGHSLGMRGR